MDGRSIPGGVLAHFTDQNRSEDEAEAPGDPSGQHRSDTHENGGLRPVLGKPHEDEDHTLRPRVVRHHVGGHEDDHHLHRELQQVPEAIVP